MKGAASDTLNTMFKAKIDELRKSGRIGTMLVYDNVLKGVERFAGKNVLLEAVTTNWVRRYADFLRNEGKAQTTISINLRHLRALLNDAKRLGVLKESQYPFGRGRYEIQAGEGRKLALSQEQIATIAKYEDGTQATAKYRDYWLFLYLCNGINVADFVKLKYNNISDGEIHFVRQKTEFTTKTRKEISVVITQPMQTIIDRWGNTPATPNTYIFPVLDGSEDAIRRKQKTQYFTRAFNRRMAEVGERLNIGRISTYTARHSFATVLKRSGANISYISESLGHQDLKTTENYLASFEKEALYRTYPQGSQYANTCPQCKILCNFLQLTREAPLHLHVGAFSVANIIPLLFAIYMHFLQIKHYAPLHCGRSRARTRANFEFLKPQCYGSTNSGNSICCIIRTTGRLDLKSSPHHYPRAGRL